MIAAKIAAALGEAMLSGAWWRCRCPAHQSSGPTLALRDGDYGLVAFCHAGCSRDAVVAELRRLGLFDPSAPVAVLDPAVAAARHAKELRDRQFRTANALDIWDYDTRAAHGTLVERYFRSRGLFPLIPDTIRASSGWLRHRESGQTRPAMVALVEHVEHGPVAVHRTYLAPDGSGKASLAPPRLALGPVGGAAVRLAPIRADDWLVVGEGIETTLSVMQATELPGWAALSANGIESLILPPEARKVLIVADNDMSAVGPEKAELAAARFRREGRLVGLMLPPEPDSDFNDLLKQKNDFRNLDDVAA